METPQVNRMAPLNGALRHAADRLRLCRRQAIADLLRQFAQERLAADFVHQHVSLLLVRGSPGIGAPATRLTPELLPPPTVWREWRLIV